MEEIVKWLLHIEQLAGSFYKGASEAFREDRVFSDFLRTLSVEEERHLQVMRTASGQLHGLEGCTPFIALDGLTVEKVEHTLMRNRDFLRSGALTREGVLDCLVTTEFSEWNDIFLYVVNCLKETNKDCMRAAVQIQHHMKSIERFLESLQEDRELLYVIRCLPPVWNSRILIVGDEDASLAFLASILKHEGSIDAARGADEALEKMKANYYDVTVWDTGTTGMSGIDCYKRAAQDEPDIGKRMIFITGRRADKQTAFFRRNNLRFIARPIPIREITRSVEEIMLGVRGR